jgi:hypothetical protein
MPTTGVWGVDNELGPSAAPPNGTTASGPGAPAAAAAMAGETFVKAPPDFVVEAPGVALPGADERVSTAMISRAAPPDNPTDSNAREFRITSMIDHPNPSARRQTVFKYVIISSERT